MESIITENLDAIRDLCGRHKVRSMYVFGSAANGSMNDASDVDILVSFEGMDAGEYADNYFKTAEALESLFNRHIDLITENSLSNPYFIESLEKSKVQVYG